MDIKQAIITKYQLRFNRLMKSIEKDKLLTHASRILYFRTALESSSLRDTRFNV